MKAFKEYQEKARVTKLYPNIGKNISYAVLGLAGEAGELANELKKGIRDENFKEPDGSLLDSRREKMIYELGDVLWYTSCIADELGISLEEVAEKNIEKLYKRHNK